MKQKNSILILTGLAIVLAAFTSVFPLKIVTPPIPETWPKPHYDFASSPLIEEQIQLGRELFYDPILSKDSTISCASCHLSFTAFTHVDHALSHGIHDSIGTRNSPVLINLAWSKHFMWDGAVNHIEVQGLAPITHPSEMGETLESVMQKLKRSPYYSKAIQNAYQTDSIQTSHLLKSLAQFQLTLISSNSKYDQVKQEEATFSLQEQKGYTLFQKHCNSCHQEPLFTTGEFANNGLSVDTTLNDLGRYQISLQSQDSLLFKIPTLRNIKYSFPYMHDGRFNSLQEVMNHYAHDIQPSATLDPSLKNGIALSSNDKADLIAFLLTLTDKSFLFNPEFGFPKRRTNTTESF